MDNEKQNTQKEEIQQRMETLGMTIFTASLGAFFTNDGFIDHPHPPLTGGLSGRVHPADRSVLQCAGQRLPPPLQPQFREVSHASIRHP